VLIEETGIPAARLELELTESVIMANAEQTMAVLRPSCALGVSLAIDDFGTGYSSLVYLKRLPIDTLKIDKEFIGDLTRDPDDEAITSTVITMAHSLGLNVVAEGVETEAQCSTCANHGCDEIQGYWLSPAARQPPLPGLHPHLAAPIVPEVMTMNADPGGEPALDRPAAAAYRAGMDQPRPTTASPAAAGLTARIERLVAHCAGGWPTRTAACASSQEQLVGERAQLLAKNEQARSRVEAMINRLKSLEQQRVSEPVASASSTASTLVGCPPEERDGLMAAAKLLDARCARSAAATAWPASTASRCWPRSTWRTTAGSCAPGQRPRPRAGAAAWPSSTASSTACSQAAPRAEARAHDCRRTGFTLHQGRALYFDLRPLPYATACANIRLVP
jgi:uncharacterized protein (TIGR02449 family)